MSYSEVVTYNNSASLNFDSTKVNVTGGHLTLLAPSPYTLTNPVVTSQHQNTISSLTSFSESSTLPADTAIQYQLVLNGIAYWYSAALASWVMADGTFATSNTAAVINSNASTLFSSLNLITNQFLSLNIFLSTTNTSNAPILTSNTIGYGWTNSNQSAINLVSVSGYLADLGASIPLPTSATPTQLLVSCDRGFFHGTNFVEPFTKAFSFSPTTGALSCSIIETETPGVKLKFSITYWDGESLKTSTLFSAIVPNQASISLSNLSSVFPYDFG